MSLSQLPVLAEISSSARVASLPLRTRFRGLIEREVLVFEGPRGWAEFSPFVEYDDVEAASWLAAAIEYAFEPLPELARQQIEVNATLPAVTVDRVEKILSDFGEFGTVKIKVAESGQLLSDDFARIDEVYRLFPEAKIRLDANGNYSVDETLAVAQHLIDRGVNVDYLEQPVASISELLDLKNALRERGWQILLAADELIRKAKDPAAVIDAGAVDVVMLKAAPLGGISKSLKIAESTKLAKVVSSAMESSIGLGMGLQLAGALPELNYACGLGTANLLAGDLVAEPLNPLNGQLAITRPVASAKKLELFKAEDHRFDWWLDRLERCYRVLERGFE